MLCSEGGKKIGCGIKQRGIRQKSLKKRCRLGRATELVFLIAGFVVSIPEFAIAQQAWDPNGSAGVQGGTGAWTNNVSWTQDGGSTNVPYNSGLDSTFTGTGGTVVVSGFFAQQIRDLTFSVDGYTISGGTLDLGVANSIIEIAAGASTTISSNITGSFGVEKIGDGTLTLSGANTYTGATVISAGTLNVISSSIVDSGSISISSGASMGLFGSETVGTISGSGSINLGANTLTLTGPTGNSSAVYSSADISGSGNLIVDFNSVGINNTFFYSGTNTSTGTTTINSGGIRLEGGSAIGDTGNVIVNSSATLQVVNSETMGSLDNSGSVGLNLSQTLTAGTISNNSGGTIFITTNSSLIGTSNTFNNAGTVNIATGGSIIDNGAVNNNSGGIININGNATVTADADNDGGNETISNAGTINVNAGTTTFSTSGTGGFSNSGTLEIDAGATANVSDTGIVNSGTVTNAGTITGNLSNTAGTFGNSGTISGTTAVSGGTVTNTGTMTGLVTVTGGTFDQNGGSANGGLMNSGGTITLDGGTAASLDNNSGTTTITAGQVTGMTTVDGGTVVVNGTDDSTLELSGATTINNGGTLTLTNGDVGSVTVNSGGTMSIAAGDAGTVTNAGSVTLGGGTLASLTQSAGATTVIANSTVTGLTDINGGTLTVNSGQTLTATSGVDIASGATGTINGNMNGNLTNAGTTNIASAVTLTGNFTNNGGASTNAGTITGNLSSTAGTFGSSGTVSGTANVTGGTVTNTGTLASQVTVSGGTFDQNSGSVTGEVEVSGVGTVTLDGGTAGSIDHDGGSTTINGATINGVTNVSGGTVTLNSGTLTGQVTVIGGTFDLNGGATNGGLRNNGGTLTLDGGTAASLDNDAGTTTLTAGQVTGTTTVDGGSVIINGTDDATLELSGATTINGGSLTLTNGDVGSINVNSSAFSIAAGDAGAVTNSGTVTLGGGTIASLTQSAGSTTVTANSSVTGLTDINGGTLTVNSGQTLTATSGVDIASGATGTINGTVNGNVTNAGTVDNNGAITGSLTNTTGTTTLAGIIGSTVSILDGLVDVDGNSTVTGLITVGDGSGSANSAELEISGGTTLTANAGITLNSEGFLDVDGTIVGNVANSGNIDQDGAISGSLTNTTGITTLSGTIGSTLSIVDGLVDVDGNTTVAGLITVGDSTGASNSAELEISGGDTLTASTGITVDDEGLLDNDGTIIGNVGNSGAGTVNNAGTISGNAFVGTSSTFNQTDDGSVGSLTGSGSIVVSATKTLSAGSDNTSTTFSGIISGSGGLTKQGSGIFTLSGANTFSGATTVDSGTLNLTGSISSSTASVNSGATLMGTGTAGAVTFASVSFFKPGASIGTINTGNLNLNSGSTLEIEVDPTSGVSDKVVVAGTVNLGGGTLAVKETFSSYSGSDLVYTIIENDGSDAVVGTFGTITNDLAFLTPTVAYDGDTGNDVVLTLSVSGSSFSSLSDLDENQQQVASALDNGLDTSPGSEGEKLKNLLTPLTTSQAQQTFKDLSGEVHSSNTGNLFDVGSNIGEQVSGRFANITQSGITGVGYNSALQALNSNPTSQSYFSTDLATNKDDPNKSADDFGYGYKEVSSDYAVQVWGGFSGYASNTDGDGTATGVSADGIGFVFGADKQLENDATTLGVALGYSITKTKTDDNLSELDTDSYSAAVYGMHEADNGVRFSGVAAYTLHNINGTRQISNINLTANSDYDAHQITLQGEINRSYVYTESVDIIPFLLGRYMYVETDAYTETGAGAANLVSNGENYDSLDLILGARADIEVDEDTKLTFGAGYSHRFGDVNPEATYSFSGGGTFTTQGVARNRHSAYLEVGFERQISDTAQFITSVSSNISDDHYSVGGNIDLRVKF